jgi:nucleotide-binding universal stress UspA family protein
MLRAALAGLPMRKEEEIRITRELIDMKGFLPRLERLLLAADESRTGRFAARLAGLIAGANGSPVTILKLDGDLRSRSPKDPAKTETKEEARKPDHAEQTASKDEASKDITGAQSRTESAEDLKSDPLAKEVKAGAKKSAAKVIADDAEPDPERVHLSARVPLDAPEEVVKDEARKGYDLMFLGLDGSVEPDGGFAPKVNQLAAGFEGPLMVLANAGKTVLHGKSRILVPVNGSAQARRAAEMAFALARATGAGVETLFVSQTDGRARTRLREERVLRDMAELAQRYDVTVTTRISKRSAAADAILTEARHGFSMILMGSSARPGEELFFGNTVTAVLKDWRLPILLLAS